MPGIVGLITKLPQADAEQQLLTMVKCIRHEPFYNCGTWSDPEHGVYVGWVARRGSFADGMPVCNEDGKLALFFSGEEFPEPALKQELRQNGHQFSEGDASYLVHRYEAEADFPKGLNGRFHGVVADRRQRTTTLFNDRFGLQRLYFHESQDGFYFAPEAKAILKVRPELRSIDPRGLGEFVTCGCVLENRTLFPRIYLLPQASAWVFRNGRLTAKNSYFEPKEWEQQETVEIGRAHV